MQNQTVTIDGETYTLAAEPSYCTEANKSDYGVDFGTDYGKRPVENVTWYDAVYYCNARSEKEGLTKAYNITVTTVKNNHITAADVTLVENANGYRLPTEDEWEYAARGGENYTYAGRDTIDDVAWYTENSSSKTHEVKTKKANGYGLYDMSGNVCEWCWGWYSSSINSSTAATGPASGEYRIFRGGSWRNFAYECAVSDRFSSYPKYGDPGVGFRVVRSAQ